MSNLTTKQLKDAMIELYSNKTNEALAAYQLAFDLLEAKIGEDKFDQFLDAYGM
jgi:hypothetical protein